MKKVFNKKVIIIAASVVAVFAVTFGGVALYVSDYYRADTPSIEAFSVNVDVAETVISDGMIAYGDSDSEVGFIFYPGGKVEYTAYEPLMRQIASDGALCVLVKMPFNLAVLDMNAADGVCGLFPEVERWYIGGHSLGGSMAASYAQKTNEDFEGLVLLGSYSTADLSDTEIDVLSVFGSEDGVMNREKYDDCKSNLPKTFTEIIIEGGCHAYFGMYGKQDGDGEPAIGVEEQICKTAEYISEFMLNEDN